MKHPRTRNVLPLLVPLVLLLLATLVFRWTNLDRLVCGLFFGGDAQWPLVHVQPFRFLYQYGPYPGVAVLIAAVIFWVWGLVFHRGVARRALFCILVVLLGPGLLVNGILKPQVSRPRPNQITDFGGSMEYRPVLTLSSHPEPAYMSFPSGHASMGFVLLAPALLLRRRRKIFVAAIGASIGLGILIGMARVIQGKHFPSDVLWSAAIVYLTAVPLYSWLRIGQLSSLSLVRAKPTKGSTATNHSPDVCPQPLIAR